jgi:hypothetical protein
MSQKWVSGLICGDFPNMKKRPPNEKEVAWEWGLSYYLTKSGCFGRMDVV